MTWIDAYHSRIVSVDRATGHVRVKAGTPLHELNLGLAAHGLAMVNLGDIDRHGRSGPDHAPLDAEVDPPRCDDIL